MNILLNKTDFDQSFAASSLIDVLHDGMKVTILPFAHTEGWANDEVAYVDAFEKDSMFSDDLVRPFLPYGIQKENITFVSMVQDSLETIVEKINSSDLIFLVGSDPDDMMDQLHDYGLVDVIKNYQGIVMGASGGALIQMDSFLSSHYENEYKEGLGLVSGVDLEIHYEEDETHLRNIIQSLETRRDQVLVLPDKGGLLIAGLNCAFMGSAFLFDMSSLDELYEAYKTYVLY